MSYVLHIWEQPAGWPLPSDIHAFCDLLDGVRDATKGRHPVFKSLAHRLTARYPCICSDEASSVPEEEWETKWAWSDGPLNGETDSAVFNLGLNPNMLDEVRPFVIIEANALGLNVLDGQAAEVHLSDGNVISPHNEAYCVRGIAAEQRGNFEEAAREYLRYAAQSNPAAEYRLGRLYLEGHALPRSKVVASALWTVASIQEASIKPSADWLAAKLSTKQVDAALQLVKAMRLTRNPLEPIAAYFRSREAAFSKGKEAGRQEDFTAARAYFEPLAEDGHPESQFALGLQFDNGLGVEADAKEAMKWYRRAAEAGFALAQCNLAAMLADGADGIEKNEKEAVEWYRRAALQGNEKGHAGLEALIARHRNWPEYFRKQMKSAEQGDARAQHEVSKMCIGGNGTARDVEQGLQWCRRAADSGLAEAQLALANWHYSGENLPKDLARAVFWYRRAASGGSLDAQYNLGVLHLRGEGVRQSRIIGFALLMRAKFGGLKTDDTIQLELGEAGKIRRLTEQMNQPGRFLAAIDEYDDEPEKAESKSTQWDVKRLRHLAVGSKAVAVAMAVMTFELVLGKEAPREFALAGLIVTILFGAFGAWRIADGVRSSGLIKFLYVFLMATPFVNLPAGCYLLVRAYFGKRKLQTEPAGVTITVR